jgi:undecaprenyl diphosphate synthase
MKQEFEKLPAHIAVIMDGNGRWAQKRLLPRSLGHRKGVKVLEKIIDAVAALSIPFLTVYAFSTENKNRSKEEIDGLIKLIKEYFVKSLPDFIKKGYRVKVIGDRGFFSAEIREILANAENVTKDLLKTTVVFALNYGSRDEVLRAVNKAVKNGAEVTGESFKAFLDTDGIPDPDMVIRTGNETRLSNFLLYQSAYAELFFVPDLWPDFDAGRLNTLIAEYGRRTRKFGK